MKMLLALVCGLVISYPVKAEFYDPMRPPSLAMQKFRLEKIKSKNSQAKVEPKARQRSEPWVLSSILYSRQRKHAIINNKLVKQGDLIKGARLIRLQPDRVRLLAKGKVIELTLRKPLKSIKKSPNGRKL